MAGLPLRTVAEEVGPPSTVRVKVPLARPVPRSGMAVGEVESELVKVRVLLRMPMMLGVKVSMRVQVAPGAREVRGQGVVRLKSPVERVRARLLREALPVLVRMSERLAEAPTVMLPKLSAAGEI